MDKNFYNTVHLSGSELAAAILNAKSQEQIVLHLMQEAPSKSATPSEVLAWVRYLGKRWPITSVRRAINNLTRQHKLIKTDHQQAGPEGMPEHIWQLANNPEKQS